MQTIHDVLSRDLSETIEEVIKLDQQNEPTVYNDQRIRDYRLYQGPMRPDVNS